MNFESKLIKKLVKPMTQSEHQPDAKLEAKKQEEWNAQDSSFKKIYEQGVGSLFAELPPEDLKKVFKGKEKLTACCMDEGCADTGDVHSAGPLILLDLDKAKSIIKESGIKCLCSHDGCGAAGLYAKANGLPVDQADQIVKEKTAKLAAELGIESKHVSLSEMKRPADFHNARMIYLDGTGKFQFEEGKSLPRGFVLSQSYLPEERVMEDLKIALMIAFGAHGLNSKFTSNEPMVITVIGSPKDENFSAQNWQDKVNKFLDTEEGFKYKGKVKVEMYTPPLEVLE